MRGSYHHAPLKVLIGKIVDDQLVFIDGDYFDGCTMNLRLDKLLKGEYLIFYHYEWTRLHPTRKVVVSFYAPQKIELKRVDESQFNDVFKQTMTEWLQKRIALGLEYSTPDEGVLKSAK